MLAVLIYGSLTTSNVILAAQENNPLNSSGNLPHNILQGEWRDDNGMMIVRFDWTSGTYSGKIFGEPFEKPLHLAQESISIVEFRTDTTGTVTVKIEDKNNMIMIDSNNMGIRLKRVSKD